MKNQSRSARPNTTHNKHESVAPNEPVGSGLKTAPGDRDRSNRGIIARLRAASERQKAPTPDELRIWAIQDPRHDVYMDPELRKSMLECMEMIAIEGEYRRRYPDRREREHCRPEPIEEFERQPLAAKRQKAKECGPSLLVKTKTVCDMLGGICARTLSRMEKQEIIKPVKLLRHKLYALADVQALVENLRNWNKRN